jgi:PiT family inorganic phosphate transporter
MVAVLLLVGIAVAVFVGFNIGGSSTGVAFGPAVGSGTVSKTVAAALMTGFALLGGATAGTKVIDTMGGQIVPSSQFTLAASVVVLFFVGLALLVSNLFGVPASTSMTAVGAIAGLGVASDTIDWSVMGQIVSWWLVAPIIAFWLCAVIGRYAYPHLTAKFALESEGDGRSRREVLGATLVVVIGCYMAYSAGASNTANAVAPLVGSGEIELYTGVAIAGAAIGLGAFTIARRTLDTVGNDLTDLPILAALIVEVVSATIITLLSLGGIPASLAVSATMCIVGLGWGRATRTTSLSEAATAAMSGDPSTDAEIAIDAIAAEHHTPGPEPAPSDHAIEREIGDAVERAVASSVSNEVDRAVRDSVGDAVGEAVEARMKDAVGDAVDEAIEDKVGEAVDDAVEHQVGSAVDDAVGEAVEDAVGEGANEAVEPAVADEVRAEVTESVEERLGEEMAAEVSEEVTESVEAVGEAVETQVSEGVSEEVSAEVSEEVSAEVTAAVSDDVAESVEAEVGEVVRAEMSEEAPDAERAGEAARGESDAAETDGAETDEVPSIGEAEPDELTAADLFDPATTGRVIMLWILTPTISAVSSYLVFSFLPVV